MPRGIPTEGVVFVDGGFVRPEDARVSIFDAGFLYGDGVFETLRTYGGHPFRLRAHLERLARAAEELALPSPPSSPDLAAWIADALERAALPEASIRITLTRGIGERGLDPAGFSRTTAIVAVLPVREWAPALYQQGAQLVTLWRRSTTELPSVRVKSTSYQRALLARAELRRRGADEGLYLDEQGLFTEGTVSNVFAVREGRLWTPPTDCCLPGITRGEVLRIAEAEGLEVVEQRLSPDALAHSDEVWVTSSLAELLPCVGLDGKVIGTGAPGPVHRRLHAAYRQATQDRAP